MSEKHIPLTPTELKAEYEYRRSERIAILCEDRQPTPEQEAIATQEAEAWKAEYLRLTEELKEGGLL